MALQFVYGSAKYDRSQYMIETIQNKLKADPFGRPIFYIVPEQMTFQKEVKLFETDALPGSTRAQVMSFSRLAFRVLEETGGSTRQFISATGTQMMIRKIIYEKSEPFTMFKKAVDKHGFIQDVDTLITELKRHCVTPEMLHDYLHYTNDHPTLHGKLMDIQYIYDKLSYHLSTKYIDGEDQLQMLVDKIAATDMFVDAEIFIDGFHHFTPKEFQILEALLGQAKNMTMALTMDEPTSDLNELDLFYQTKSVYLKMKQLAAENQVGIYQDIILDETYARYSEGSFLDYLAAQFAQFKMTPHVNDALIPLKIREAVHPRAEIEGVIQEILRLTREENYRYKDMVVFLRDQDTYGDLLKTLFEDYDIPLFIDDKRPMLNHSFIEFIRSLLEVIQVDFKYDSIFRLLKTGYFKAEDAHFPLTLHGIDQLENYCLEYGIRNRSQWFQSQDWRYQRFQGFEQAAQTHEELKKQEKINAYRKQVIRPFEAIGAFNKTDTVKAYCVKLYDFVRHLQIPEQLEEKMYAYEARGLPQQAREEEQVWQGFIQLIDEMVELIGEDEIDFDTFKQTMDAGLEALEFSHVPPSLDYVIVASIDRSRIDGKKCGFLLGVNEGYWPMNPGVDGMITESERAFLQAFDIELAASKRRVLLDDQLYMYLATTAATDQLWLSYAISDGDGKGRIPAQLVADIKELFPTQHQFDLLMDPDELFDAERFLTTAKKTRTSLVLQLSRYLRGYPMQPLWGDVLKWYLVNEEKWQPTHRVLQSLFYENKPYDLSAATTHALYPKQIKTSVSRLESYYQCSYKHFANYDLKLEKRKQFRLEAPDIGQLFHEALRLITDELIREQVELSDVTKDNAKFRARRAMKQLSPVLQHNILKSSKRYEYIAQKLEAIIAQAIYILSEQTKDSAFSPLKVELGFGLDKVGLSPLSIELENGYELLLRGRIDRVDQAVIGDDLYLRIVDYKSSRHQLALERVYYGLSLQMLAYLHVMLLKAEVELNLDRTPLPGGMLYFHIKNALLSMDEPSDDKTLSEKILKDYKMGGYITDKESVALAMEPSITGSSNVIPARLTTKGAFYKDSKILSDEALDMLRAHVEHLCVSAGIEMTSGHIQLNPYEDEQSTACAYCDFKAVCQFDPILKENNYRQIKKMPAQIALNKIKALQEKGE